MSDTATPALTDLLARLALLNHAARLASQGHRVVDLVRGASADSLSTKQRDRLFDQYRTATDEGEKVQLGARLLFGPAYALATATTFGRAAA